MTGKEQILEIAKKKKVFRAGDVDLPPSHTHRYLARLVQEGTVERVGYELYSLTDGDFTEMQSLLEVSARVPNGILCLLSAHQFHDLTTQNPFEVWIAIPRGSHIPKVDSGQTRIFRYAPKFYEAGIETHLIHGVEVKVYSAAKTVDDCFYFQKTVGLDVSLEALRDAWRTGKATMDEFYHFAEIRRVKNMMIPYLKTLA